jgi:hypothetical protein
MDDERPVRPGFLPPKAPGGVGPWPARPPQPAEPPPYVPPDRPVFTTAHSVTGPSSPMAVAGTALGAASLLLLFLSAGLGYYLCGLISLVALALGTTARRRIRAGQPGREGQAKAAVTVASIGLGLALVAAIAWAILSHAGFGPDDLRQWLQDLQDRLRRQSS